MKQKKFSLDKLKKISKHQLLAGGLAGILLLVIAIPVDKKEKSQNVQEESVQDMYTEETYEGYGKQMERKLEKILGSMEGVGNVKVMITLRDEGEQVVEKDRSQSSQDIQEEDDGLKRTTGERQSQETTVYSKEDGGGPFVAREMVPRVEGVLVVAEGGGNAKIAKNISDAVLALFPVEVHKIKVVKMN